MALGHTLDIQRCLVLHKVLAPLSVPPHLYHPSLSNCSKYSARADDRICSLDLLRMYLHLLAHIGILASNRDRQMPQYLAGLLGKQLYVFFSTHGSRRY